MNEIIEDKKELELEMKILISQFLDKHNANGMRLDLKTSLVCERFTSSHQVVEVNVDFIITI